MIRTRWLHKRPKVDPPVRLGAVGIRLADPRIIVAEKTKIGEDASIEQRSVGLTIEQGDIHIEVNVPDPKELLLRLTEAEAWARGASTSATKRPDA